MEINKMYKIMNKDGLFSSGGYYPYFSKIGKTWSSMGRLKGHLAMFTRHDINYLKKHPYRYCTVVEIECIVKDSFIMNPFEYLMEKRETESKK